MYYYAVLNENNFVVDLGTSETDIADSTHISITEEQYSSGDLLWLYYKNGQFIVCDNFIGSCDWISYKNTDRPITPKFDEIDRSLNAINNTFDVVDDTLSNLETGKANVNHTHTEYATAGHVHGVATIDADGFMSKEDKTKFNGIEAYANNYTHPTSHPVSMITETDSQKIMTAAERTKLSGIAENANNYTHPATHLASMIEETSTKKIMTATERTKLAGIESGANLYTHPSTHPASMITGLSDVATSGSYNDLSDKPTSMNPTTHTHNQNEITGLETALSGKSNTNHTHTAASTSVAGFMSADDKIKLNGIAVNANAYTHPATHPASMITGLPTALPANGGNADTVDGKHAVDFATASHNHDSDYADINHNHNSAYAGINHNHDTAYADISHTHEQSEITGLETALAEKAASTHNHNSVYAGINHNHNDLYATVGHNHDNDYAGISHTHDGRYFTETETNELLSNKAAANPIEITKTGEDLNNYTTAGIYSFAVAYTPLNIPSGCTNGWLIVIPWSKGSTTIKQIFLRHGVPSSTDHYTYIRLHTSSSGWSEWSTFYTNNNPPTAAEVGAMSKDLQFTNNAGGVEYSYSANSGKNLLTEISNMKQGFHTIYSINGTTGNPKSTESFRLFVHKTSDIIGWILAFGADGSIYSNYQYAAGSYKGWKCIYDIVAPELLWFGNYWITNTQTVTPSKALSKCKTGWMLVWSDYDTANEKPVNSDFYTTIIPKRNGANNNWSGQSFIAIVPHNMTDTVDDITCKRLYVHDTKITGHASNRIAPRNDVCLRAIYEI